MATYGSGFKIQNAIANSSSSTVQLYSAPANRYALVNVFIQGATAGGSQTIVISIGGVTFASAVTTNTTNVSFSYPSVLVGPSQALSVTITGGGTGASAAVSGVEFSN
jgi:hypothetical protein